DTHYTELNRHDQLMAYLDSAITAFHEDLTAYGMADRVMIATWSEFGRRPKENASGGTDHGTASPVFLIGDGVKGGLYGETPSLAKLDQLGNLSYSVDFRAVYQEILAAHLGVDAEEIPGQSCDHVPFGKARAACDPATRGSGDGAAGGDVHARLVRVSGGRTPEGEGARSARRRLRWNRSGVARTGRDGRARGRSSRADPRDLRRAVRHRTRR